MSNIAYFIGGPLDLTKRALEHCEPQMYALGAPAMTLNEINTAQEISRGMEILCIRHRYERSGARRVHGLTEVVVLYLYAGTEGVNNRA